MAFEKTFEISWAHLDRNDHMANTAYMWLAIDTRFAYFASRGFRAREFSERRLGPVVRHDEIDYYRELHFMDTVRVNLVLAGLSDDASRFRLRNEFFRADGDLAARVTSLGGWFDLQARRLVAPPEDLAKTLRDLDRSDDFETLQSSVKKGSG